MLTIRIAILLVNGVIRVREGRLTEAWRGRPYNSYVKKKMQSWATKQSISNWNRFTLSRAFSFSQETGRRTAHLTGILANGSANPNFVITVYA